MPSRLAAGPTIKKMVRLVLWRHHKVIKSNGGRIILNRKAPRRPRSTELISAKTFHDVGLKGFPQYAAFRQAGAARTADKRRPPYRAIWLTRTSGFAAGVPLHPEVTVSVVTAYHGLPPLTNGIDISIRFGNGDWPECTSHLLFSEELVPVASASYNESIDRIRSSEELLKLTLQPKVEAGDHIRSPSPGTPANERGARPFAIARRWRPLDSSSSGFGSPTTGHRIFL